MELKQNNDMMQATYFDFEGRKYALNLKKIFEYVSYYDKNEKQEKEICNIYSRDNNGDVNLVSKQVKEITAPGDSQVDNIRYDMIKTLLVDVMNIAIGEEMSLSNVISLNTLINEGLLIEIE